MPLSELYRSVDGKNEPSQQNKSADISYMPNNEFVELVWEKGQIMMQGQSSKAKKMPVSNNFQFHTPKVQEKDAILDIPEMGLNQDDDDDDDMVPWLNYPLDDYCSDLLPEISGVPMHHHLSSKDPHSHEHNTPRSHWPLDQMNHSDPTARSGVSEIGSSINNNGRTKPHNLIHKDPQGLSRNLEKMAQNQDSVRPFSTSTLLNFSHFSRPAAIAKANLENNEHPGLDSVKLGSNSNKLHCVEKLTAVNGESSSVVFDVKSNDPVRASSSVCSGNSVERACNSKRKSNDMEDFECESQDVEDETLGTKTAGGSRGGTGSKRSRAAEVHNLSERRRRDRINEKMRALQELIPNCNKVDKASMLDEAIEYLKRLQLQVQIMSMGAGLCMSPMMLPPGMHPHFSPMGIGMGMNYGMGMGMGMGMEMNPGHPNIFPFPPPTTAQGSRPVYGHPSQGMPLLFPQSPMHGIPMVQHIGGPCSKDPMQNKNPHVMTQIGAQAQVGNNQSTSVDKKDHYGLKVECTKADSGQGTGLHGGTPDPTCS